MGTVVSIQKRRTERLADAIEQTLMINGGYGFIENAAEVDDPRLWRRAAVVAAHRLGYRATTWADEQHLVVVINRPITDDERQAAAKAVSAVLRPGPRPL